MKLQREWQRPLQWFVLGAGGFGIAIFMLVFHQGEETAQALRERLLHVSPWWFLLITPCTLAIVRYLTLRFVPYAASSGIPQVMAVVHDRPSVRSHAGRFLLTPFGAVFKALMVCVSMLGGGTVGREGPAIQIGASLLTAWGFGTVTRLRIPPRVLVIAGAATGLAAAFSTPLAGFLYAFEEFVARRRFRRAGFILLPLLVAVLANWALTDKRYFFDIESQIAAMPPWWATVALSAGCGLFAGAMGWLMVIGLPRLLPTVRSPLHGAAIAGAIGLALAALGVLTAGLSMGSGNETSIDLLKPDAIIDTAASIGLVKLLATTLTFMSGVPGGILTPSIAIGGGFGYDFALLTNLADSRQYLVMIGMAAFLAGVIRAPVTAAVLIAEMTGIHGYMIELLITAWIGSMTAKVIMSESLYEVLLSRLLHLSAAVREREKSSSVNAPT